MKDEPQMASDCGEQERVVLAWLNTHLRDYN